MRIEAIAGGIVALIIAFVVGALVAIPVIDDSIRGTPYEGENLVYDYKVLYLDENPTFTWHDAGTSVTVTYGGETDTFAYSSAAYIVATDKVQIRHGMNNAKTIWDLDNSTSASMYGEVILEVVNGAYTLTRTVNSEEVVTTGTIQWALVPSNLGTWAHFATPSVKATLEQPVFFGNWYHPNVDGPNRLISVTDGADIESLIDPYNANTSAGPTVEYQITYEESATGNEAVGQYSKVVSTWTPAGSSTPISSENIDTYAPLHYESTSTGGVATGTDSVLLSIIPVLLILVAIMIAVRMIVEYRT